MDGILKIFKYLAYLQLVFLFGALFVIYKPLLAGSIFEDGGSEIFIQAISNALVLLGFSFSLVSLRDHSKIDKMGRWFLERPKFFKAYVYAAITISIISLVVGILFFIEGFEKERLAIGLCSFGVGFLALIKSLIDQAKALTDYY